jgi:enamine deaminase RidA (YjgF/YER057c/UK114 family)
MTALQGFISLHPMNIPPPNPSTSPATDPEPSVPPLAAPVSNIERRYTNPRMSKIVRHGGLAFLCGQTASGSASEKAGIAGQVQEALSRVDVLLTEAGSNRARILAANLYLRNISDFAAMNEVWESWIPKGTAPARTTVEARLASENLLFEVTVTAAIS